MFPWYTFMTVLSSAEFVTVSLDQSRCASEWTKRVASTPYVNRDVWYEVFDDMVCQIYEISERPWGTWYRAQSCHPYTSSQHYHLNRQYQCYQQAVANRLSNFWQNENRKVQDSMPRWSCWYRLYKHDITNANILGKLCRMGKWLGTLELEVTTPR